MSSDDDVPSDIDMSDPYFKEELQGSKSKKKSRKVDVEESEEVKQKKVRKFYSNLSHITQLLSVFCRFNYISILNISLVKTGE